jgi:hypothetical protein
MPSYLQNELAVPSFMKEAAGSRPFDWQSAKNKRPRREAEILSGSFAIHPDTLDGLDLAHSPLRNDIVGVKIHQQWPDSFQAHGCTMLLFDDWIWT